MEIWRDRGEDDNRHTMELSMAMDGTDFGRTCTGINCGMLHAAHKIVPATSHCILIASTVTVDLAIV